MITTQEDLLAQTEGVLVHGVNCQGVMNSGLAKQIRKRWPLVYDDYLSVLQAQVAQGATCLGGAVFTQITKSPVLYVASCFTQQHYGRDPSVVYVDYRALENTLLTAFQFANKHVLPLHVPNIGCGLANGDKSVLRAILLKLSAAYPGVGMYYHDL